MTLPSLYTMSGILVNTTVLGQVSSWSCNNNVEVLADVTSGYVDPTFSYVPTIKPELTFETASIKETLDVCGISGYPIDSGNAGVTFYLQKLIAGGTRSVTTDNHLLKITNGILIPDTLSASNTERAKITMKAHAITDGTVFPIVKTTGSLHAFPTDNEGWEVGPLKINGTIIQSIETIDVNFGITTYIHTGEDGLSDFVCIDTRLPEITITSNDSDAIYSVISDLMAVEQSVSDSVVYLRKLLGGAARVPDITAEHISFTIDAGTISVESIEGGMPNALSIKITPIWDGTAAIMAVNTATAIS